MTGVNQSSRLTAVVLCLAFGFSGAAALVFEALLFRLTGLVLGNGVWAVAIVLTSFMAGLAIGNWLAGLYGPRLRRPMVAYAKLEFAVAASGLGLVYLLPLLPAALAPVMRAVLDYPVALNVLRLGTSLALMTLPAAAMGMTLPVAVRALAALDPNFGRVLGYLYGWNTLGGVVGVLVADRFLVGLFGVNGAAMAAASLNIVAACLALMLDRVAPVVVATQEAPPDADHKSKRGRRRILVAAFGAGAILLALEVVWFRLLLLFTPSFGWNLAVMLAVVLAGIGCGGLLASLWYRWRTDAHDFAPVLFLAAAALVAISYRALELNIQLDGQIPLALLLMFPVCVVSGVLYTLLGRALADFGLSVTRAAARVAIANTIGSAVGSVAGGFVLMQLLGMERSLFLLALSYAVIAFVCDARCWRKLRAVPVCVFVIAAATYPFGAMDRTLLQGPRTARQTLAAEGLETVLVREGPSETIQYAQKTLLGEAHYHRLSTNNTLMSGTMSYAGRYMKMYVYWPIAINPEAKNALLISYGVGQTAKALTDTAQLEHIDVVDISREILETSDVIFPDRADHPLHDPRVKVHVEDGRFFLLTTDRRYDLITSEPPPPRNAGVVNLYSREYFELIHSRLSEGGIVTYWLPVSQMHHAESKAILRGFLDVFPNGSLWTGAGFELMMVGVKGNLTRPSSEAFARQWHSPVVGPEMRLLGLLEPEQLGATFIADGPRLSDWVGQTPALTDNHPQRVPSRPGFISNDEKRDYMRLLASPQNAQNFQDSAQITALWPKEMREGALEWFAHQHTINMAFANVERFQCLHAMLSAPQLVDYLPWAFYSDPYAQRIVAQISDEEARAGEFEREVHRHLAARATVRGDLLAAVKHLRMAGLRATPEQQRRVREEAVLQLYLLLRAGEIEQAVALVSLEKRHRKTDMFQLMLLWRFWDFAVKTFAPLPTWEQL